MQIIGKYYPYFIISLCTKKTLLKCYPVKVILLFLILFLRTAMCHEKITSF